MENILFGKFGFSAFTIEPRNQKNIYGVLSTASQTRKLIVMKRNTKNFCFI